MNYLNVYIIAWILNWLTELKYLHILLIVYGLKPFLPNKLWTSHNVIKFRNFPLAWFTIHIHFIQPFIVASCNIMNSGWMSNNRNEQIWYHNIIVLNHFSHTGIWTVMGQFVGYICCPPFLIYDIAILLHNFSASCFFIW